MDNLSFCHLVYWLGAPLLLIHGSWSIGLRVLRSRSEQAPGSVFHPHDINEKNYCDFLGPSWCNIKVDPETLIPFGSYKPLVSYVAHQMKEKIMFQN